MSIATNDELPPLAMLAANFCYFAWYNTARPHSSLDRVTSEQAYLDALPKLAKAA